MRNSFSTMALSSLFLVLLLSSLHVVTTIARATPEFDSLTGEANSISPKAYLVHYWDKQITNNFPKPLVLFSKVSPLTAASATIFTQLVSKGAISDHLLSFCEEAKLLCFLNSSFNGVAVTDNDNNLESADASNELYSFSGYTTEKADDKKLNRGIDSNLESADASNELYSFSGYTTEKADDKKVNRGIDSNLESADASNEVYSFSGYTAEKADDKKVNRGIGSNLESADASNEAYSFNGYTAEKADDKNENRGTEPSAFFRESMLKRGNVMSMPNIRDNLPKRSFLPRSISSKLPFSTSKLAELKQIFHSVENSTMEKIMARTLGECERAAIHGETKTCVTSIEDMINFATSILGHDVMVRSTEGFGGSKQEVLIGLVNRIKGAEVSKPVACHQNLFPYMVYYCHAFENVRIYEVDILDRKSKAKINHGVAICHMDTSAWAPTHKAFLALGSGPGQIEVCHWAFENSMVWTTAE